MQMTNVTTENVRNGAREIASLNDVATLISPRLLIGTGCHARLRQGS